MHRALPAFVVSAIFICITGAAQQSFGQNQTVTVSVFSDVSIPQQVLELAKQRASQIFSSAGIDVGWINCIHGPSTTPDRDCRKSYGPGDLALRITSHVWSAGSDAAFGVAWLAADGSGRYADVFWTRAQELHTNSNVELGRILGSVMAHEMGHLLLGANSHSVDGLMQARWGADVLERIALGTLFFSPEQGKRMRAHLAPAGVSMALSRNGRPGIRP
ncbi:MAG TPA: hypothetical protein VKQ11_04740 [Candidatus Sulfotelmatobacter sp.]|nr:hypothetical protein [Candidatus Sulfotelmatobacter sp.]